MTAMELASALAHMDGSGPGLLAAVLALLWQISGAAKRGAKSVQRIGRRVGALEQSTALAAASAAARLQVLEDLLRDEGLSVPRYRAAPPMFLEDAADDDDDQADDDTTVHRVPVPSIPPLPHSLRRS